MRRAVPAVLLLSCLTLTACGDDGSGKALEAPSASATAVGDYSAEVRENFLTSCLENATKTSNGAATEEQLTQTCECILGKVEQEYSEADFAQFEQRLLDGKASDEENGRLVRWSTDCAREATG